MHLYYIGLTKGCGGFCNDKIHECRLTFGGVVAYADRALRPAPHIHVMRLSGAFSSRA